jgi:hypothetical protein
MTAAVIVVLIAGVCATVGLARGLGPRDSAGANDGRHTTAAEFTHVLGRFGHY